MAKRFLKLNLDSDLAEDLLLRHPNAFTLLYFIAKRARREPGLADGLNVGECHIGDHKSYGLTEREYRTAKKVLVDRKMIKIIETCRTRQKSTTASTTVGTRVKILNSTVWDLNINLNDDRHDDRATTERRRTRRNKKEEEKNHLSDSSFLTDDPLSSEKGGEREQIAPNVFLSQKELAECIAIKGSRDAVIESIEIIQESPGRTREIKNWPRTLKNWPTDKKKSDLAKSITREKENIEFANKLCSVYKKFEDGRGWQCAKYYNNLLDENGIIFEPQSAYKEAFFVAVADGKFKEKCERFIEENIKIDR